MKLKAASDRYTDAMVDLGLARTVQLSEVVESGFERLETQVRRGMAGALATAVGITLISKANKDPLDLWLSKSVEVNATERNKNLSLQESSNPSWIFERPEFIAWLDSTSNDNKNLWLFGTTGFGKSVLAAYLTETLPARTGGKVTYFFCKDNQLLNTADHIVRTIIYQLTSDTPEAYEKVKGVWNSNKSLSDGTARMKDYVDILLAAALEAGTTVYFVLDALNEIPKSSRPEILSLLGYVGQLPLFRIIATSQPTEELVTAFKSWQQLELQSTFHEKTIESYVRDQLTPTLSQWFEKSGVEPIKFFGDTSTGHRGMFIWVATLLRYLKETYTFEEFQAVLKSVPADMNALYRSGLDRLEKSHTKSQNIWIREIFSWVTQSPRDITTAELKAAISSTRRLKLHENPAPDAENIDIDKILVACGAFVRVHKGTGNKELVSVVHSTFGSFIVSKKDCGEAFFLDCYEARQLMTLASIEYLSNTTIPRLDNVLVSKERRVQWDRKFPLFRLASRCWYTWLYYLGPGTWEGSTDGLIKNLLELAGSIVSFLRVDILKSWIRSTLIYAENEIEDTFTSVVAKAFRNVMIWLNNHEEFFRLKIRGNTLGIVPRSQRHIKKYLNFVKSEHLEKLDTEIETKTPASKTNRAPLPNFALTFRWRKSFRTSSASRFQSWVASCTAQVWLETEAKYMSNSMEAFFELSLLYEFSRNELSLDNTKISINHDIDATDYIKTVREWALPNSRDTGHCTNVNIAHAYKWLYGRKEPGDPRNIRLAIQHYRDALADQRIHFTADILQSLSRASTDLFNSTLQLSDLDDAIKFAEEAVQLTSVEDPLRGRYTAELCEGLDNRAILLNSKAEADEAVEYARRALQINNEIPGIRGKLFGVLISGLVTCYEITGSDEYLTEMLDQYGRTMNSIDGDIPTKLFGELKAAYNSGAAAMALPRDDQPDPFRPFLSTMKALTNEYFSDRQRIFELIYDPDLLEQEDILGYILWCVGIYYYHHKRYDLSLYYSQQLRDVVESVMDWLKRMVPDNGSEPSSTMLLYIYSRTQLNILIGDSLMAQEKEEPAK